MFRRVSFILILSMLISSCGAAAPAMTEAPVVEELAAPSQDIAVEPTAQAVLPENTPTAEPTSTLEPSPTQILPTPTETPLPPLELPTEIPNAPSLLAWDGTPTYLGDSQPGFDFRVLYDPELWALTQDQFGYPAIGHRNIPYCVISVTSGRGLPANVSVEQDILYTDTVTFSVGTAFENGVKKFVTYTGGDDKVITGFEVSFKDQAEECIADAVTVVTTLQSIPSSRATPEP
jgi:hypothetical protein